MTSSTFLRKDRIGSDRIAFTEKHCSSVEIGFDDVQHPARSEAQESQSVNVEYNRVQMTITLL